MTAQVRKFDTGATRSLVEGRIDPEGFISPLVTRRYCEYMNRNSVLPDGSIRDSDNWQQGIPLPDYAKSLTRHVEDFKLAHRGYESDQDIEDNLCAIIFNASGYLHELRKAAQKHVPEREQMSVREQMEAAMFPPGIVARVPPFVDDEEPGSLKNGEAYREAENYGGSA